MHTKSITAPTIHAALVEARRQFGDDVVLLESIPPHGNEPARVTVMIDQPVARRTPATTAPTTAPKPKPMPRLGFGYTAGAAQSTVAALRERAAAGGAAEADGEVLTAVAAPPPSGPQSFPRPGGVEPGSGRLVRRSGGRGRLFDAPGQDAQALVPSSAAYAMPSLEAMEDLFETQLARIHARIDALDRRVDPMLIGTSHRWTAHPLFGALLDHGFRSSTVTRVFDRLADKGLDPADDDDNLKWAVAQELRRLLDVTAPKQSTGTQVFVGPSGAGKTALILKLAKHPSFFGRHRTTVIAVAPDDDDLLFQSPVDLFRRFDLPTQSVRTPEEMERALQRVQTFDQILIDTPPLPTDQAAARQHLLRLRRLLAPVVPLHVQFVLNATRALDTFDTEYLQQLPLAPSAVAVTHLDEAGTWGRVAEWLLQIGLPVQFAATSPRITDGAVAFSPSWFVETMLSL